MYVYKWNRLNPLRKINLFKLKKKLAQILSTNLININPEMSTPNRSYSFRNTPTRDRGSGAYDE